MQDVKVPPNIRVESLLMDCLEAKREGEAISFQNLKDFLKDFDSYFKLGDRSMFVDELMTLKHKNDKVFIKDIALMIKSDIEMMPKWLKMVTEKQTW